MQLAADYLVDKGHRHFAFVADSVNLKDTARRREVFQRRLKDHSYRALGCDLAFRPDDDIASLERAQHDAGLIQFLRNTPKPLGVFALTDHYARALCMLCEKLGLDVPNEVAILGSGNLIASRSSSPTLSSVETGNDEIGYEAMKMLHHLMHGGRGSRRPKMIPPVQVIERESSCPGFTSFGSAQRAREFIRSHACEGIRVADVVRALSISRRTMENHFRQSVGHSPGEEIALVRLERAKELLTETDLSMTHVSGMAGFNEPPRFNAFFRRHVGLSPSEYRQRWQDGA